MPEEFEVPIYIKLLKDNASVIDAICDLLTIANVPGPTGTLLLLHLAAHSVAIRGFETESPLSEGIKRAQDVFAGMAKIADASIREMGLPEEGE